MARSAREIAEERADEIAALGFPSLDRFETRVESVEAEDGRRYRVKSRAFWDMEPGLSDLLVVVTVRPSSRPLFARRRKAVRALRPPGRS